MNVSKPVIILGAGGHARVVAEMLRCNGRDILGVVTPDLQKGVEISGMVVLGDDQIIFKYQPENVELANGIGALPANNLRWHLANQFRNEGYIFSTIVHPGAIIARDVELAEGVQVMAGAVLQPGVLVGCDTIINTRVSLDHDCSVAECCHIAPGVTLSGSVKVDSFTHIGTGTCVVQGVHIGNKVVVAAGSVLYRDIPDNVRVIQEKQNKTLHNS